MSWTGPISLAGTALAIAIAVFGCGGMAPDESEVKRELRELPYRFRFRPVETPPGADAAIAGRAFGQRKTYVDFGISFGSDAEPVPVPEAWTSQPEGFPAKEYVLTANLLVQGKSGELETGKQIHNGRQWREAARIVTAIEQALCLMATEKPCPV